MAKKTEPTCLPDEPAAAVDVVARGKGNSVNALIVEAPTADIERVRHDDGFMAHLREIAERDREPLERLAQ